MYEAFYSLSANPFRLTPDPDFCFAHASHKQARAYLEYALKLGEGFIMVTGRPGTGKTTLIESFIKELDINDVIAEKIAAINLEAAELLRAVAYTYGIDAEGLDKATLRLRIQQFFSSQVQSGRRVLLIIDEAQGLSHAALEELRLLADLQTGARPLLQLFLVGQDSLRELMRLPDMEQFQQRVIGTCFLEPLDLSDTRGYIEHRLRQAGWNGDPEITGAAIVAIYRQSRGVPRHINKTCTRLLLHGLLEGKHKLDEGDVLAISAELREEQLGPLDGNAPDFTGPADAVPVPELADGSLSIAEFALRVERKEREPPIAPVRPAAGTERKPATPRAARLPVARHVQSATKPRQIERPVRKPVAGWPDVIALYRELAQYGVETARKLNRRLQWQGGLALKLGALVVATLSIVTLITPPEDDASEQTAVLARHSALSGSPPAQPAAMGDMGALNPDTARRQADGQDTESRQIAVAQQQARESLDAAVNTGVPADVTTQQALPGVAAANTPASDPVSKESESQVSTWPSATAIADDQPKPLDANDDQVRMPLSGNQAGAELARDAALQDEATVANGSVAEAGAANPKKIELAALKSVEPPPLAEQAPSQQTSVDDDVMPPPVSAQQKINELLSLGRQALSEDRLLIPPNNSAYDYYHQVLRLEPGNADASEGIEQIVQRYTLFARRALDREDEKKARQYITRGLRVRPGDQQLLVLQERMNNWLARLELEAMSVAESAPSPVTEQPSPQSQNFLSRLKAFFSRVQHENQETDLWDE